MSTINLLEQYNTLKADPIKILYVRCILIRNAVMNGRAPVDEVCGEWVHTKNWEAIKENLGYGTPMFGEMLDTEKNGQHFEKWNDTSFGNLVHIASMSEDYDLAAYCTVLIMGYTEWLKQQQEAEASSPDAA